MNKADIQDEREAPRRLSASAEDFRQVRAGLECRYLRQDEVIEQTRSPSCRAPWAADRPVPGLAKTKLVDTWAP